MIQERRIQRDIRLVLGGIDEAVFWRNNVGLAQLADGSMIRFGLAVGSSDLIGCVGGRFCALEIKSERGALTKEQTAFLRLVRRVGGFGCDVRSVEDAVKAVERCRGGDDQ